ncbi:MAG: type-F conjugative transfer system mating-pair stabilization protein TraN, partial [Saezia sp.]
CREQVANPSQSQYFGNDKQMITDGQRELNADPNASNLQEGFSNRPKHTLDLNDPAYRRAQGYMDDAYNISHGISSKYHNCETGQRCEPTTSTRQCKRPTLKPVQCYVTPFVRDTTVYYGRHDFVLTGMTPFDVTMPVPNTTIFGIESVGTFRSANYPVAVEIVIDGSSSGNLPITKEPVPCDSNGCLYRININRVLGGTPDQNNIIKVNIFTKKGSNGTPVNPLVTGFPLRLKTNERTAIMGNRNSCGMLLPECRRHTTQCIEGKETRILDGLTVTLDCWKEQISYQCNTADTCSTLKDCTTTSSTCDTQLEGVCISETEQRTCESTVCEDVSLICGEQSFCLDGDCYEGEGETNENFSQTASALAAVGEAAKDISADNLLIFTGKPAFCDKKPMGLSDCCKDDGWGNDIGLTDCSSEEKGLMEAKKKGLTIELGEFCAESVLGVCIRKKKSYCQFDSKMARIIQQQGKKQLNIGFGSNKHPVCTGITPEQLQVLDFSQVDFTDFYEDLDANLNLPDMDEITERIKDKYQDK